VFSRFNTTWEGIPYQTQNAHSFGGQPALPYFGHLKRRPGDVISNKPSPDILQPLVCNDQPREKNKYASEIFLLAKQKNSKFHLFSDRSLNLYSGVL
jgi:hypothetical protein